MMTAQPLTEDHRPPSRLTLFWRWSLGLVLLIALLLVVINILLSLLLPPLLEERTLEDLTRQAILASPTYQELLQNPAASASDINHLARHLSARTALRITIINRDGAVIGESDKPPASLASIQNHLQRPEIQQALRGGTGHATRRSTTVDVDLLYAAVRVDDPSGTTPLGYVRVALPLDQIDHMIHRVQRAIAIASTVVGLLALAPLFYLTRRITKPIDEMRRMAMAVAGGDFRRQAPRDLDGEIGDLSDALNAMSHQLSARIGELDAERAELAATLSNMVEGVLVVDAGGTIRMANRPLMEQFRVNTEIIGHTVIESFRSSKLQDLVEQTLAHDTTMTGELTFPHDPSRVFEVNAARLRQAHATIGGAVLVFHDITRIRQLENIRKDFVANVSHELRTPLSIIKGYIETLLEDHDVDEETVREFHLKIQKHSRRLEALIGDLLTISTLESPDRKLELAAISLPQAVDNALEELAPQAQQKEIQMTAAIPAGLSAVRADSARLHQVLVNLLDNGIKYSAPQGEVRVTAVETNDAIEVCVADKGPGIAANDLERIFERFYRVDKARSRALGGTGLGLSIVKHIVQAQGGRVWAESQPDQGSRFFFTLRKAPNVRDPV